MMFLNPFNGQIGLKPSGFDKGCCSGFNIAGNSSAYGEASPRGGKARTEQLSAAV